MPQTRFAIKKLLIDFVDTEKVKTIDDVFFFLDGQHFTRQCLLVQHQEVVLELIKEINYETAEGLYQTERQKREDMQQWVNQCDSDETGSDPFLNEQSDIASLELNVHYTEESLDVLMSSTLLSQSDDSFCSFATLFMDI